MQLNKASVFQFVLVFCTFLVLSNCSDDPPTGPTFDPPPPYDLSTADSSYTTDDGLQVYIIEEGYSPFMVTPRDQINVRYTGRTMDGRVFDSTYQGVLTSGVLRNLRSVPPASGGGSVLVDGFRRGVIGMREGEKRTLIFPPSLGYGDATRGTSGYSLRNDTLRFDVEIVSIQ